MRVAILAEQNFNLIDGSTIWLLNTCKLLSMDSELDVHLLLTHPLNNSVLADDLPSAVTVIDALDLLDVANINDNQLRAEAISDVLTSWEFNNTLFDRIYIRGTDYLTALLSQPSFAKRVVGYAPSVIPDLSKPEHEWLTLARSHSVPLVVQSDPAKRVLETLCDYPQYQIHVVSPTATASENQLSDDYNPVNLSYSGKIDLHYGIDWLLDICNIISDEANMRIGIVAGKDTNRLQNRNFFKRMDGFRNRIEKSDGGNVFLSTNVGHTEAKLHMAHSDFAYCLRHEIYEDVIEVSTKIIEYCTLGVPPILNDNSLNRSLFGDDYPYYVDIKTDDITNKVVEYLKNGRDTQYQIALDIITKISNNFSTVKQSELLSLAIKGFRKNAKSLTQTFRHIHVATHERKFLDQFTKQVGFDPNVEISWKDWPNNQSLSADYKVPENADTVFCEWCCENAVWHSHNKAPGTKLIVRLHRFEAFSDFPDRVHWGNVDALVVVSEWFRDRMIAKYDIDPNRIHVIPQYIDWQSLQRPKHKDAQWTIGLVGINPFDQKRFDRAIDFFSNLRAKDSRFRLAVRSAMPWEIKWAWDREDETREKFEVLFHKIFNDPDLSQNIRFDAAGPDMAEWYRGVGMMLSSSDSEGCHTAILEGMASGCLPVVFNWPGAKSLYAPHVYGNLNDAIATVIDFAESADIDSRRKTLSESAAQFDIGQFARSFMSL